MNATPERVANPDEDGGVHVLALGKLRKGSGRYTGGKTHLRTRHPPVNEQLPKPIVAECHIASLFNVNCGTYNIIFLSAMTNK
jgi:hypothetical protein